MDILRLFYDCDEFCREFVPQLHARQVAQSRSPRQRETPLSVSEVMTILILFQTPGNVDVRKPVPKLARRLFGKLFGDRGYLSHDLFTRLWTQGVQLVTKLKKKLKNQLLPLLDKILLRKRTLVETVNDQLKNICQIEHTRHRSLTNFVVNLLAALIAYTYQEKKPSLNFKMDELETLPAVVF